MKYFLITTALEETWRDDVPALFIGEWCRLFSRKQRWAAMNAEVLPYHWDDQDKFTNDYQYLRELYERVLEHLASQLNQIHDVSHGLRYWRMLVGPWLAYFIQMLFDRWCSIQQAASAHELSETIVITGNEESMVPNDLLHLNELMVTDEWNHHIYSTILQQYTRIPVVRRARSESTQPRITRDSIVARRTRKAQLASWYSAVASYLTRDQDAFFIQTSLPFYDELRLHYRFKQIPLRWSTVPPVRVAVDSRQREWVLSCTSHSAFETCALALIPKQIPTLYVEGYKNLIEQTHRLRWPKCPRLIFTSTALFNDAVSTAYIAEKVEQGARLAYGQHGGFYGIGKFSWFEEHEIAVAHCFLSWGWSDQLHPKVRPVGMLKGTYSSKRSSKRAANSKANILLVLVSQNRYGCRLDSDPKSSQLLNRIDDAFLFADSLPISIRDRLLVRLFRYEYGWKHSWRWRERYPSVRVDSGLSRMKDLLRNTRLAVYTYNSTGYLETFASDLPTIVFWDPVASPVRQSAIPYFEDLKQAGIFHETPESAARHVAAIWDDVDGWWSSPAVRAALKRFSARYCHCPDDLLDQLESVLRSAMAEKFPRPDLAATDAGAVGT
jgi:putative transferase (TIGR04331 family)